MAKEMVPPIGWTKDEKGDQVCEVWGTPYRIEHVGNRHLLRINGEIRARGKKGEMQAIAVRLIAQEAKVAGKGKPPPTPAKAGNGDESLKSVISHPKPPTREEVQAILDEITWRCGDNVKNWSDCPAILAQYGITLDDVNDRMWSLASQHARQRSIDSARAHNLTPTRKFVHLIKGVGLSELGLEDSPVEKVTHSSPTDDEGETRHPTPNSRKPRGGGGKRYELFGYPITAILRWCGKQGWNPKQAQKAMESMGVECSYTTIQIQVRAGLKGDRGDPANLSPSQAKELEAAKGG